jgi:hypothetical protein
MQMPLSMCEMPYEKKNCKPLEMNSTSVLQVKQIRQAIYLYRNIEAAHSAILAVEKQ